jgi:hypothetical protein
MPKETQQQVIVNGQTHCQFHVGFLRRAQVSSSLDAVLTVFLRVEIRGVWWQPFNDN